MNELRVRDAENLDKLRPNDQCIVKGDGERESSSSYEVASVFCIGNKTNNSSNQHYRNSSTTLFTPFFIGLHFSR